ncbi:MAG: sulfurtransferase complex subunit TusB [Armatimonadota bacterium]
MSTLFVLSHAPHADPGEVRKLAFAAAGDAVILIEDAVYAAAPAPTPWSAALEQATGRGLTVHVLAPDAAARGVRPSWPTVDYAGWLALLAAHQRAVH